MIILSCLAHCTGELKILKSPDVAKINNGKFSGSSAGQLFQACMGYSTYVTDKNDKKFDLDVPTPFGLAEYANTLRVTGVSTIPKLKSVATITMTGDEVSIDSLKGAIAAEEQTMDTIDLNQGTEAVSWYWSSFFFSYFLPVDAMNQKY